MNLPESLAREIRRVSQLECLYRIADVPRENIECILSVIGDSLERGCLAIGAGDAVAQLDAIKELKGIE
jgi:hypothetical protein